MAAPTSVVVLDRGNNTTCTINLHGKFDVLVYSNTSSHIELDHSIRK